MAGEVCGEVCVGLVAGVRPLPAHMWVVQCGGAGFVVPACGILRACCRHL